MALEGQITEDLKIAMKARDVASLACLRMLSSALKNVQIAKPLDGAGGRAALTDDEALKIVQSEVKKLRDALADFERGGRQDLVEKTKAELAVIQKYLPAQMSDGELTALVSVKIAELGASDPGDLGRVVGAVMKTVAGKADGNRVKAAVQKALGG